MKNLYGKRFNKTLLSLAIVAASSASISGQAVAAETTSNLEEQTEVIQVKGYRSSVIKAKDLKRDAMVAQDSIVAEDIADFPDLNLADSLQRVPGVVITREGGEGRQISLRGLGPDFTRVQVNGMEALGTSSSPMDSRGAVSRSRAFDFNIFASELFNQIDVKKSYSADQEEGGIGGTVNLRTARPFDYDGFQSVISAQVGTNSNTDSTDPRFAGLVSNTWGDFGALLSVAYSARNTNETGYNTTRWRTEGGKQAADQSDLALQAELDSGELWFPRGSRYSVWENEQERLGITASLQYKASDNLDFTLDIMHGQLTNDLQEHHNAVKDNKIVEELEWVEVNGDKEVVYAKYNDATWRNESREDYNESTFNQITLKSDWQINDDLSMTAQIGTSSSDYDQPKLNKVNIHAHKQVTISTDLRDDSFYGVNSSPDFDLTTIDGYTIKDLYFQEDYMSTDFDNAKVDFDYFLGEESTITFGANYKKFSNSFERRQGSPSNPATETNQGVETLNNDLVEIFTGHPSQDWLASDIDAVHAFYGLENTALGEESIIENSSSTVTEETMALYAQYGWDGEFAGAPLRASFGLRYYDTELTSEGISQGENVTIISDYSGVLPTLNLVYEINDELLWRFGASKNLTRPSLSAISVSADVSQTSLGEGDIGRISLGNPALKPFESINLDTSLEMYMDGVGFISAAIFYKDIENFIVTETEQEVYAELGLPEFLLPDGKTVNDIFNVTSPQNSDTTTIKGLELAYQRDFDFLPEPFNNLGVIANYTRVKGENLYRNVQDTGLDQVKSFPGLSENSYNLTFYYETEKWGARIAAANRSEYISVVEGGLGDEDERGFHATTYVDFSAFYQVTEALKFSVEGMNLTDVRNEQYSDSNDRVYNTTNSGRTFMAGLTYKF